MQVTNAHPLACASLLGRWIRAKIAETHLFPRSRLWWQRARLSRRERKSSTCGVWQQCWMRREICSHDVTACASSAHVVEQSLKAVVLWGDGEADNDERGR